MADTHARTGLWLPASTVTATWHREETLEKLHAELDDLEGELQTQREMCHDMHGTIDKMQDLLKAFRKLSRPTASADAGSESATE